MLEDELEYQVKNVYRLPRLAQPWRFLRRDRKLLQSATLDEVAANNYVLSPGRYVGSESEEDDGVPFEEKMQALTAELARQFEEGARIEKRIRESLEGIGLGV